MLVGNGEISSILFVDEQALELYRTTVYMMFVDEFLKFLVDVILCIINYLLNYFINNANEVLLYVGLNRTSWIGEWEYADVQNGYAISWEWR